MRFWWVPKCAAVRRCGLPARKNLDRHPALTDFIPSARALAMRAALVAPPSMVCGRRKRSSAGSRRLANGGGNMYQRNQLDPTVLRQKAQERWDQAAANGEFAALQLNSAAIAY